MKKSFAIGDIHGCLDKLRVLLDKIPIDWDKDMLIFLGDYIDRGPDSCGVIELLIDLKRRHKGHVIFLQGNHEWMFSNYLRNRHYALFLMNGGQKTLESYRSPYGTIDIPKSHREFLEHLELFYETEDYIFVHAGLRPGVSISDQDPEDLIWIRSPFIESSYDWGKRVIFGHTPFLVPLVEKNKIGIDTGAVYGRTLTCLILPDLDFISV